MMKSISILKNGYTFKKINWTGLNWSILDCLLSQGGLRDWTASNYFHILGYNGMALWHFQKIKILDAEKGLFLNTTLLLK